MTEKKPFAPEIHLYSLIAILIEFLGDLLAGAGWKMSPSRGYKMLVSIIVWFRDREIWHFDQPAFLYVMEQLTARADSLAGTYDDESRSMEMDVWKNRDQPIPGGIESVLQIFDWFMPALRRLESAMVRYFGNPDRTANGHAFTEYEAWDTIFLVVDRLYKDPHFGAYNNWGQPKAYPWVQFIRDEMYEQREVLKPSAPAPPAGYEPPFSTP